MSEKKIQPSMISLNSSTRDLNAILQSRSRLIQQFMSSDSSRKQSLEMSGSHVNEIVSHCNQYAPIRRYVQQMISNEQFFKSSNQKSTQFWSMNEKIQKQLQKRLQNLKIIDTKIQDMIQQEINMVNEIEDTQQMIRAILNKKQQDHILKAQPLYMKKQAFIEKLQIMKSQKQQVKQEKLQQLTYILDILNQMKQLRIKRLQQCKETSSNKQSIALLECLSKDIEQVIENKNLLENSQRNQLTIFRKLQESNTKILRLADELTATFQMQQSLLKELEQTRRNRSQIECFNTKFMGYFDTTEQNLFKISSKFSLFIEKESQKSLQLQQVTQGINTTQDTIEIFQNLKFNLENQTIRKNQLIQRINNLTKIYSAERQRRQIINNKQVQIQSLKITHKKLSAQLEQAAQQADVKQYKIIHSQISQISQQINLEVNQLQRMKTQKRQVSKKIYTEMNIIQQDFRDLISEILPQIWLRDQDFSKQETIADFQVYLTKLFSRLKILS